MQELLYNEYLVLGGMAIIIFLATQILKLPIKIGTKHIFASNPRAEKIANATINIIPFALGIALEILYSTYILHTAFSIFEGLNYGTAGISLYNILERFFKDKIPNPYKTAEGMAVTQLVDAVVKDGKVDKSDIDALKEFWDKVK